MSRLKRSKNHAGNGFFGNLLLSRRGVYLISCKGKLRCFRLVPWTDILARLEA